MAKRAPKERFSDSDRLLKRALFRTADGATARRVTALDDTTLKRHVRNSNRDMLKAAGLHALEAEAAARRKSIATRGKKAAADAERFIREIDVIKRRALAAGGDKLNDRQAVTRWVKRHPDFRDEYSDEREAIDRACEKLSRARSDT
jgi:hypothetical protein